MVEVVRLRIISPSLELHAVWFWLELVKHAERTVQIGNIFALEALEVGKKHASHASVRNK